MSETFSVGEIAILCNTIWHTENEGVECEIIGGLEWRKSVHSEGMKSRCYTWRTQKCANCQSDLEGV